MNTYSDEYLNHWGQVFEARDLYRRHGIPFVAFLRDPQLYLQLDDETDADSLPLNTRQQFAVMRHVLEEMEATQQAEQALPPDTRMCNGRMIEPLKHHHHKRKPAKRLPPRNRDMSRRAGECDLCGRWDSHLVAGVGSCCQPRLPSIQNLKTTH